MLDSRIRSTVVAFAATVFLSAFLLFQVQPLLSKAILPWFGGTPSVWTTCMLFFQTLLFGGYAYAHLLARRLTPRSQMFVHIAVLIAAAAMLPVAPSAEQKPDGSEEPISQILLLLTVSVGLPFFALSSTGPLLQSWFARTVQGSSPYRLYALSNAGSLLALVSYPFAFEPVFDVGRQSLYWSIGFVLFAILCTTCAFIASKTHGSRPTETEKTHRPGTSVDVSEPPSRGDYVLWFLLAMTGSVMLLATTNQVCLDVASIPFLWVLPLALYLLTFILCFDSDWWYSRVWALPATVVSLVGMTTMIAQGAGTSLPTEVAVYFSAMFCCVMLCHGELVRLKPDPEHLTAFYLVISAGGAAGGLLTGVVAPLLFPIYLELPIGLLAVAALALVVLFRDTGFVLRRVWLYSAAALLVGGLGLLGWNLYSDAVKDIQGTIEITRNFYGVLRVTEEDADDPDEHRRMLKHGRIEHGMQYMSYEKRRWATTYYGHPSAVGLVLDNLPKDKPVHVGVVGLGVGTIATYARPGDRFRFYEINPDVVRLAREHFYYLQDCRGETEMIVGDARLMLERESPQQFDVLILDAFSSDAIPAHLLTIEAFEAYKRHLKPNGTLLVHISNRYFDLQPVVAAAGETIGLEGLQVESSKDYSIGINGTTWVVLSGDLSRPLYRAVRKKGDKFEEARIEWTDTFSNLLHVLD